MSVLIFHIVVVLCLSVLILLNHVQEIRSKKKFGLLAKEYLKTFIKEAGKDLIIKTKKDGKGKYGRILGELFKQGEEKSINTIMVEKGYAVAYYGQSKNDIQEEQLQNRQRLINEGLIEI